VAADTMTEVEHRQLDVGIVHVRLAGAVADLAGERLVLELGEQIDLLRVAFIACFLAGVGARQARLLNQGIAAIPSELPEGLRGEEIARHHVTAHDADGQEHQSNNLRRQ